ncbi:hypothetical protein SIL77_08240 [Exiguobacterium profundum]|uniref:hypothetical protein n=1 Tax=Exiguobacterium TaxID=33986 RepID=UPI0012F13AB2|nr:MULTISPECIES: hypothetical protein [Exiguobacterium]MDX5981248.1 hypothetical protein [Exiguobacterium profundum]VXC02119.1 conserved membrane hypothetical protein [Exiguobacterium sp. 8H]VXC23065.1 conserved membrane hypothetical protein [Exiguobacterium sp. 8A]
MKAYYPSIFAVIAGLSGLLGLLLQSVYPIMLFPVFLLIAGYFVVHTKKQKTIVRNYTPSFLILSSAALAFGLGFQSIIPNAMLIGILTHTVCLFCAIIALGRYRAHVS